MKRFTMVLPVLLFFCQHSVAAPLCCNHTGLSRTLALLKAAKVLVSRHVNVGETMMLVNPVYEYVEKGDVDHKAIPFYNVKGNEELMATGYRDRLPITLSVFNAFSPETLQETLKSIKYSTMSDPLRKTIFVDLSSENEEIVPKYFQVLWQNGYLSSVLLKLNKHSEDLVDVYYWGHSDLTWNCGRNPDFYRKIGFFSVKNGSYVFQNHKCGFKLFSMQPASMASNCTLRVGAVILPPFVFEEERNGSIPIKKGFEVQLIREIAAHFNLQINFKISKLPLNWGHLEQNGTATGAYKYLMKEEIDIGISAFSYNAQKRYVDFGVPYGSEQMIWCVPKTRKIEPWTVLLGPYGEFNVTIYIAATISSSLTLWLLSRFRKNEPQYNKRWCNCFFRTIADVYTNTYSMHRPRSNHIRLFQIFWLFCTFHVSVLYSGSLYSLLTIRVDDNSFATVEDVLNSGLRLQILPSTNETLRSATQTMKTQEVIKRKYRICRNIADCIERVAITRDSAICLTGSSLLYLKAYHIPIQCIGSSIFYSYTLTIVYRKHYFLRRSINSKVASLFEAGLIQHWKKVANEYHSKLQLSRNILKEIHLPDDEPPRTARPISLPDLVSAFIILINGYLLAGTVFLVEMGWFHVVAYRKLMKGNETETVQNLQVKLYREV